MFSVLSISSKIPLKSSNLYFLMTWFFVPGIRDVNCTHKEDVNVDKKHKPAAIADII